MVVHSRINFFQGLGAFGREQVHIGFCVIFPDFDLDPLEKFLWVQNVPFAPDIFDFLEMGPVVWTVDTETANLSQFVVQVRLDQHYIVPFV